MNKKKYFLLFLIFSIGFFLRLYKITEIPPSLEWDEVATGYDAYSILKTGRDQYGKYFPFTIRSLDDYKPPLYTYLTAVSIGVFGWNDFAVRFPAAFFGALAIISIYAMVKRLFKDEIVSLLSGLALALSPWHVNFSRLALETNTTIFITTLAVWAFLKAFENGKYFLLSAILFGLDLYLYHNARVFVPLFGVVLLTLYYQEILRQKRWFVISAMVLGIFFIRLIPIVTSVEGTMRFSGTSIFSEAVTLDMAADKELYKTWRSDDQRLNANIFAKFYHNDKVFYSLRILKNYLVHFNPTFWLFTNDQPRHHVKELGILYLVDLPFIYIGLFSLFQLKKKAPAILIFSWWLIGPVAASVTRDVPHSLRSELMLPAFIVFIAFGIKFTISYFRKSPRMQMIYIIVLMLAYVFNVSFFLHQYFVHFAKDTSSDWQYGRKEAALYADSVKDNYDNVIVSTKLEQPHVFFLYYLRYDPQLYLKQGGTYSGGWAEERNHFDKFYFKTVDYMVMSNGHTLFVGLPSEFPNNAPVLKKVHNLLGEEVIWIVSG